MKMRGGVRGMAIMEHTFYFSATWILVEAAAGKAFPLCHGNPNYVIINYTKSNYSL